MNRRTRLTDGPGKDQFSLYAGTFLVALALLAFEINTVRTINFAVGPSLIYLAIALAMLGLSGASSLLSLFDIRNLPFRRSILLFWFCVAIASLLVLAHFIAADQKAALNALIADAGRANGLGGVLVASIRYGLTTAFAIGLGLSLPYFLFGALLALLFTTSDNRLYGRLYASDLIGAALGCIAAILLMETTSYAFSVTAPAAVVLIAGSAYAWPASRKLAILGIAGALALGLLPQTGWYAKSIEPRANTNYLARDYQFKDQIREVWRDWNSYTRVGGIVWEENSPRPYAMMSLGNGDGMAWVWPFDPDWMRAPRHRAALPAMLLDPPGKALVLFAGTGADMMSIRQFGGGLTKVTGVELNAELVAGATTLDGYRVADLLNDPLIDLQVEEGRVFLERETGKYDLILLSFSGATASHYTGALGGTTQFLFTYEGLESIFGHLTPDGYAVILQVNKVSVIGTVRRYIEEHGLTVDPMETVIVLFTQSDGNRFWRDAWDNNPMLFKPSGWTAREVETLVRNATREGYSVAYAPGYPAHPEYLPYARVLQAGGWEAEMQAIGRENRMRLEVNTDDRPFYMDVFSTDNYLDAGFWKSAASGKVKSYFELAHVIRILIVVVVAVVAFAVILGPLAIKRGPPRTLRSAYHLIYFFCLGTGFMLLEIGVMQRAGILFGNPGVAIAIVLGALILFTGLGSLLSDRVFRLGVSHGAIAALAVLYALFVALFIGPAVGLVLAWPMIFKTLALILFIAPGGLIVGQLFPQGLALAQQDDVALVPWAWAINGALSTVTAGAAPILAQIWGFSVLFYAAAALYAVILLLPPYRSFRATLHAA